MKRVIAACLEQTLHFQLKEGVAQELARELVRQEYAAYRTRMDRQRTRYRILEEVEQPDGSLVIRLKRQNNTQPVGSYLD